MRQNSPIPVPSGLKWAIGLIAVAVLVIAGVFSFFEDTDRSSNYVCQMPITGQYEVWVDGGLKTQKFGNIYEYKKTYQVTFTDLIKNEGGYVADNSNGNPAASLTFNDKGRGFIVGSLRAKLPLDADHMKKIQQDFGGANQVIEALIKPTIYKTVQACGPMMTSLESVAEKRTYLTNCLTDQMNDGLYKTKVIKDTVLNEITGEKEIISRAEIVEDPASPGGFARQERLSPFAQYGITVDVVSITDIKYDAETQKQIDSQKEANLAVITSKTEAIRAQQKAIQIAEEGKAATEKARWEQEQIKIVEVTKAEQQREVSRLAAEKAEFDKKRIIAEGEAEAAANRAKVAAGLTPQEAAEWKYKTTVGVAEALAKSEQSWVPKVMMTGTSGSGNAMDAVGLNMLMQVVEKMNSNK
jgi:hypothetical protein